MYKYAQEMLENYSRVKFANVAMTQDKGSNIPAYMGVGAGIGGLYGAGKGLSHLAGGAMNMLGSGAQ